MGSEALRSLLCQPVDFYQRPESTSTISDKNRVLRYTRADFAELNRLCHAKLHCPKGESEKGEGPLCSVLAGAATGRLGRRP
jgi:hypothetical protein